MLDHLKPISSNHSISKVIATVFIPQAFIKPEDVFEKMKNLKGFEDYPKKSILKSRTINLNQNDFAVSKDHIAGFLFESYDKLGSIDNIVRVENIKDNQAKVSIENRNYSGWNNFKNKLDQDLETFGNKYDFYIDAISLNYRDEFNWNNGDLNIPVELIFNINSELLNKKFLNSRNGTLILISQGTSGSNFFEEKTEISFNNDLKRIIIDHQFAIRFNEIKLFSELNNSNQFSSEYDLAHTENKKILKDILTIETQTLINLN